MTLGAAETCQHTQQIRGRVLHCFVTPTSCPLEDVCLLETLGTEFTVALKAARVCGSVVIGVCTNVYCDNLLLVSAVDD